MTHKYFTDMNYVAKRPCGCLVMAAAIPSGNAPKGTKRDIAGEIAACIREGFLVEQATTEWIRSSEAKWSCPICKPEKFNTQPSLFEVDSL